MERARPRCPKESRQTGGRMIGNRGGACRPRSGPTMKGARPDFEPMQQRCRRAWMPWRWLTARSPRRRIGS